MGWARWSKISIMPIDARQVKELRDSGKTLQQIADEIGFRSRENVRQMLVKHYGTTATVSDEGLLTTEELAMAIGYQTSKISRLKVEGIITPAGRGRYGVHLWGPECVAQIRQSVKKCKICGNPVPKKGNLYCSKACYIESKKFRYLSKEQKETHNRASKRWREQHPDQAKEINRRAGKVYYRKHREGG